MGIFRLNRIFHTVFLLCAAACILGPVLAETGSLSIAYRGSGGATIGDTVVFDGRNPFGNTTLISITGPGLPAEGVPANNLNGAPGTATPVNVDPDGKWKFAWYSSVIAGSERLQTARYTFTAKDALDSGKSASISFMMKKPEYSISVSPNPVTPGKYVQVTGSADDITTVRIEITDAAGSVPYSVTTGVSSSGYFIYGFHADLEPGEYRVIASNPALKTPFSTTLSVVADPPTGNETPSAPAVITSSPGTSGTTGPAPAPTRSPAAAATVVAAVISGIVMAAFCRRS